MTLIVTKKRVKKRQQVPHDNDYNDNNDEDEVNGSDGKSCLSLQ